MSADQISSGRNGRKYMNLPNKLTLLRVVMIPIFVYLMLGLPIEQGFLPAAIVFAVASFTDFLDGYIARRDNLVTDFGKLMDPLADKLLVTAALIGMVALEIAPAVAIIIILSREFIVTSIRLVAAGNGRVIAADKWGKFKTVSQMLWIIYVLLFYWAVSSLGLSAGVILLGHRFETFLMLVTTLLTVLSGANYIVKNKDIFLNN